MKMFAIQGVCPEKALWQVMRMLETSGCQGLLARPTSNGDAHDKADGPRLPMKDIVLSLARKSTVTAKDAQAALSAAGYITKAHGVLHTLLKNKQVRRVGIGKYVAVKQKRLRNGEVTKND